MRYNIAVIEGDGIGPEIVGSAIEVMKKVGERFGHEFVFNKYLAGGNAIDKTGEPLPKETVEGCLNSDSVLLGAAKSRTPFFWVRSAVRSGTSSPAT